MPNQACPAGAHHTATPDDAPWDMRENPNIDTVNVFCDFSNY